MDKNIFFIVGQGRSGTHFLGKILSTSRALEVDFEVNPIFQWVRKAAYQKPQSNVLMKNISSFCKQRIANLSLSHYVNKSHPSLWLVEDLCKEIPSIRFMYTSRNIYSVVASSLIHKGVADTITEVKRPTDLFSYLGIIHKDIASQYETLSTIQRMVIRWLSYESEAKRLKKLMGHQKFIILKYENLVLDLDNEIKNNLSPWIGVEDIKPIKVRTGSIEKYKDSLSSRDLSEIDETIKLFSPYFRPIQSKE